MDPEKPETTEVVQEEAQNQDNGQVELHRASIEDLDAALKTAQEEEAQDFPEGESQSTETPKPIENPASTDSGVATQGAEPSKPVIKQGEVQGNQAEIERLRKQGEQKELFIQHRSNEIGQLRSQLAASRAQLQTLRAQLATGLEDRFAENPVKASEDRDKIKEIDSQIAGLDNQEERAGKIVEAQTFFLRHVDTEKVSPDDIAEMLKADGIEEKYVAAFKANPWEFTTPEALVQMGKRALDRKEFVQADSDRRVLAKHVLYLNEQLKAAQARPGQVISQVQKRLNQAPSVTAASSAPKSSASNLDPARVPFLSNAELNAALKNATMN